MEVDFETISGQPVYSLLIDGKSYEAYVYEGEDEWQVLLLGQQYPVQVEDEREKRLRAAAGGAVAESGEFNLKAPMPGLVVAVARRGGPGGREGPGPGDPRIDEDAERAQGATAPAR